MGGGSVSLSCDGLLFSVASIVPCWWMFFIRFASLLRNKHFSESIIASMSVVICMLIPVWGCVLFIGILGMGLLILFRRISTLSLFRSGDRFRVSHICLMVPVPVRVFGLRLNIGLD